MVVWRCSSLKALRFLSLTFCHRSLIGKASQDILAEVRESDAAKPDFSTVAAFNKLAPKLNDEKDG